MLSSEATRDLPVHLTSFVGREAELRQLPGLVLSSRLVTLTGGPGCGKSRLAAEVGGRLQPRFPGGVQAIDLGDGDTTLRSLQGWERIGDGEVLLVLESCEHVTQAASSSVEALLRRCARVRVLATSREALGVGGEIVYPVTPLAHIAAVRLFADRAAAANPSFSLDGGAEAVVSAVCRRLDGVPLAVEAAASLAALVPPAQLAELLHHDLGTLSAALARAGRHRTVECAVAWSHALLGLAERTAFRRLAVFAGGFDLEAAEAMLGDGEGPRALDAVAALVARSLVIAGTGAGGRARYRMLEIVRHHGLRRLAESGEEELVRGRHCRQVRSLVERAVAADPADAGPWLERLREEHRNVLEAVAWLRPRDPVVAAQLVTDVGWFRGGLEQVGEARDCISRTLVPSGDVAASTDARPLTRRERQVARLVSDGLTNRLIAAELGVAERTVDAHVDHIRNKLGVRSRAQIARWVAERMAAAGPPSAGEKAV